MARPRDDRHKNLLRPSLDEIINLDHLLARLAAQIDWGFLDQCFASACEAGPGQPGLPTRLVAGLFILKHPHDLSDEALCARWLEKRATLDKKKSASARTVSANITLCQHRKRWRCALARAVLARDQAHGESLLRLLFRAPLGVDEGAGDLLMHLHVVELAQGRLNALERLAVALQTPLRRAAVVKAAEELVGIAQLLDRDAQLVTAIRVQLVEVLDAL